MDITLQVDGAQISDEVKVLLDNLNPQQKQDMALQLLKDAMCDTETRFNHRVGIEEAVATMEKDSANLSFRYVEADTGYRGMRWELQHRRTDKEAGQYEKEWRSADAQERGRFDTLTKYFSTPLTYFRENILKEMMHIGCAHVEETVKGSEKITTAINKAVEEIEHNIPAMVQNSMQQMFVGVLNDSIASQALSYESNENNKQLLESVIERLDRNNVI